MTDQERDAIVERLRAEQMLRQQLAKETEGSSSKGGWWESKIALLLIGSVVSSLLVPWLQYTQKTFEWRRQNRFENVQFRLERMRACVTEFVVLSAFVGEAYERARPLLQKPRITSAEANEFQKQFIELQNRRFLQNAKVVSLMIHFADSGPLSDRFQEYLSESAGYFRDLEQAVRVRQYPNAPVNTLDAATDRLDKLYSTIVARMTESIGRREDDSEKLGS